ncbi:hypothetical protein HYV81_06375 [Candidatus Woesearchaeota archaeon]|nr:hypothetical protein [Candidatus Woesearchaeota archaeon]
MVEDPIQVIGMDELDDMEIDAVDRLSDRYYNKIGRKLKKLSGIAIHIKKYNKAGKQQKCSVHVKAVAGKRVFASTKAVDWYLNTALHKAFEDILRQVEHEFHVDDQHQKAGSVRKQAPTI